MTLDIDIRSAIKEKKIVLGSRSVFNAARNGRVVTIIYASNVPQNIRSDIRHCNDVSGISVQEFGGNSLELGELCGKPFSTLIVGIIK